MGVGITNVKTHEKVVSKNGFYNINAFVGDTLVYSFVGVSIEKREVTKANDRINVVLMNKQVNCLGGIWTKKQYKTAEKQIINKYKALNLKAAKIGKWD